MQVLVVVLVPAAGAVPTGRHSTTTSRAPPCGRGRGCEAHAVSSAARCLSIDTPAAAFPAGTADIEETLSARRSRASAAMKHRFRRPTGVLGKGAGTAAPAVDPLLLAPPLLAPVPSTEPLPAARPAKTLLFAAAAAAAARRAPADAVPLPLPPPSTCPITSLVPVPVPAPAATVPVNAKLSITPKSSSFSTSVYSVSISI